MFGKSSERPFTRLELLAHNLTISFRVIAHDEAFSTEEKLVALSHLNELQRQIVSKIRCDRLGRECAADLALFTMIRERVRTCPPLNGDVGWAIKTSYESASAQQAG